MVTPEKDVHEQYPFLAAGVILAVSLLVYCNTLSGGFVWDDRGQILSNASIRSLDNIPHFFLADSWKTAGQAAGPYYRPVLNTLWTLQFLLFGEHPWGYHLINIILHASVSVLLFVLFRRISGSAAASFFSALIFAVHPVHVENVAWIAGGGYIVCTLFIALAFLFYLKFSNDHSLASLSLSLIFYTLSVFSMEYALMFPLIIVFRELLIKRKMVRLRDILPFSVIPIIYILIRASVVTSGSDAGIPLFSRFLTSPVILTKYLIAFFLPVSQKILHDITPVVSVAGKEFILSLFILSGLTAGAVFLYVKQRTAFLAFIWFIVFLLPVLNIVVVIKPQMMALRYLYIPSIGLALLAGVCIERYAAKLKGVFLVIIVLLSVQTVIQNRYWHDELSLYGKMVSDAPSSAFARNNLGVALLEAGMPSKALPEFEKAVQLDPDYGFALFNLGNTYQTLNFPGKAIYYLQKAISINPSDSRAYNSLGLALKKMGRYQEAIAEFERSLEADPRNYEAHYNAANLLFSTGREREAAQHYKAFIRLAPAQYNSIKVSVERMLEAKGYY